MFPVSSLSALVYSLSFAFVISDGSDGNPHGWDRTRRCDHTDYSPPCGTCEGIGGIPYGDDNDEITLTSCDVVANASDVDASTLIKPVWGPKWSAPVYFEILIGPKVDPFCFSVIPSNSSTGDLCYRADYGSQIYDMTEGGPGAVRFDLNSKTPVGNITSEILHADTSFWIVNKLPWYALGVEQCICTQVHEGGAASSSLSYPIQYNWTSQMSYIGRENIGIEYIDEIRTLDHWAFGPHHAWSDPDTGATIRLWQPYNGLQIFPNGTQDIDFDESLFEIPPALCKKGGALARIKCDDDGYPTGETEETKQPMTSADSTRAERMPGDAYKGTSFGQMSEVLNGWLGESDVETKDCDSFNVTELRQLQAILYLLRDTRLDDIYQTSADNRRMRHSMEDLEEHWQELDHAIEGHTPDHPIHSLQRDGHCHEAVMWFVHHLTEDVKELVAGSGLVIPLLSFTRHDLPEDATAGHQKLHKAYEEQVTCASCHSYAVASS